MQDKFWVEASALVSLNTIFGSLELLLMKNENLDSANIYTYIIDERNEHYSYINCSILVSLNLNETSGYNRLSRQELKMVMGVCAD